MITLYSRDGITPKVDIHQFSYDGVFMQEASVTATLKSPTPIDFEIGDYVMYRNEKYILNYVPAKEKQASKNSHGDAFIYESIKFNFEADDLNRVDFLDVVRGDNGIHLTSQPRVSFFAASVQDLVDRIQANLDRVYTGTQAFTLIVSPDVITPNRNISVEKIKCWEALGLVNSEFGANFIVRGRTITIGTAGMAVGKVFGYGKGNGLYDIQQVTNSDALIITRLRAFGSTRNLPNRYYNKLKDDQGNPLVSESAYIPNLMLPSFPYEINEPSLVYIDSDNKDKYGIREGSVFFDDQNEDSIEIYPSIEGMTAEQLVAAGISVSLPVGDNGKIDEALGAINPTDNGNIPDEGETPIAAQFTIILKDLGFDLSEKDENGKYKYATTDTMQISMKSGMGIARTFDVVDNGITKDTSLGYTRFLVICNRFTDDSINMAFPNSNYPIAAGDRFVILGISMPEAYVKAAAERLLIAAQNFLAQNDETKYTYIPKIDENFMARNPELHQTLKEGDILNFSDTDLNIDASVIIQTLRINEGDKIIPTYEVTLSNDQIVGTLTRIQNSIAALASNNTGITLEQVKSLVQSVGSAYFLSKRFDDTANGHMNFMQNVSIVKDLLVKRNIISEGTVTADQFGNSTFTSGQFGSGFKMWKAANGQSYAELDNLLVRREMIVNVLTIAEIRSVGGQILVSVANMSASAVLDGGTYWKVSFDNADGTIPNYFAVDDQVICRRWTGTNIVYYWAKVTSIGTDYINISKTDKDGSGIPSIGDEIIQFGNRTNTARQSAIIISAYGSDAPSIKQYSGINSYDLTGKEVTIISPLGNKFTGNFIIQATGKSVSETIDSIQVGGRNFVRNSKEIVGAPSSSAFNYTPLVLSEGLRSNTEYTISIGKTEITSGTAVPSFTFLAYNLSTSQSGGVSLSFPISSTRQSITFTTGALPNNGYTLLMYTGVSGSSANRGMKWTEVQLEIGNKRTSWNVAPEDVQTQISETKASIVVLSDQIASKVEQTDFNTLQGRVSDAESSIIQNANSITSTVTKVEAKSAIYRSLTNSSTDHPPVPYSKNDIWVTYEGAIKQAKVTKLDGLFLASDWELSTKYIDESAIDAIQIGGRNFFKNATSVTAFTVNSGSAAPSIYERYQGGFKAVGNVQNDAIFYIADVFNVKGWHTISFNVKVEDANFENNINASYNGKDILIGRFLATKNSPNHVSFSFNITENLTTPISIWVQGASGQLYTFTDMMFENGNKATSYTIAPEDVQAGIDAAQNTANTKNRIYYQDMQPTAPSGGFRVGDMWYKASLVDFDGNINANVSLNKYQLQQRWDGSTWIKVNWSASRSWVKQTDDQIISVVEKTGINDLGAGETLKSLIDQTPEKIQLAVSSIQIGGANLVSNLSPAWQTGAYLVDSGIYNPSLLDYICLINYVDVLQLNTYAISFDKAYYVDVLQFIPFVGWLKTSRLTGNSLVDIGAGVTGIKVNIRRADGGAMNLAQLVNVKLQIEQGNKFTSFRPSANDVQSGISAAQTTANNAQTSANTANSLLADIANDNKLDPSEKQTVLLEFNVIQSEYGKNVTQANTFGVSYAAYTAAADALYNYLTPLLSNMNVTSDIVGNTFRSTFKAYYDSRTNLLNAITVKAKESAVAEVKAGITITSDSVDVFGDKMVVNTTLIANAIQTEKLKVGTKFEVDTDGKIYATDGEFSGKISATSGSIAGFSISDGKIGSEFNENGLGLFSSSIKFVGSNVLAAIGENVLPGSSGLTAVARFENSQTNSGGTNYGIIANVSGAATNIALALSGMVSGLSLYTRRINANTTLTNTDVFISCLSGLSITLPANPDTGKIFKIFRQTTSQITINGNGKSIYSKGGLSTVFNMGNITISTGSSNSFVSQIWSCDLVYDGTYWNLSTAEAPLSTV